MRSLPPEIAKASKELVEKYLADSKTMVLLVVPATDGSLQNSTAMSMVLSAKKQARTILALTQCDYVHADHTDVRLTQRILGASDLPDEKFFGCVAVINRTHTNADSIDTTAAAEHGKFDEKFGTSLSSLTAQERAKIHDNTTVSQLVRQVDRLFHQDICSQWKPWALKKLEPKLQHAQAELQALGASVSEPYSLNTDARSG